MSDFAKGRGVKVEIGYTEGADVTVSAIAKQNPLLATATAHGLAVGSVAYFDDIVGMDEVDGQAIRVNGNQGSPTATANQIYAEDLNSTDMADFTSGVLVPITAWATLFQSTQYQLGGGAPKTEDVGVLLDRFDKVETVKGAAETVTIDVRSLVTDNLAMAKIRQTARQLGYLVFRITHPLKSGETVGAQRLFRGQPSIPGESLAQGATGTGQMTVTVKGQILYLAPITG